MDDILCRIINICEAKGISQTELADAIGISRNNISEWKGGRTKSYLKHLAQIANKLEVSVGYLMGEVSDMPDNLTALPQTKKVPLLGDIACGEPILAIDNIVDFVNVPFNINADFALTCKGDSMINARIFDGDVVYIRQQSDVENGEIAAVLIEDEATLKRVYKSEGKIVLSACNPLYEDKVFINGETRAVRIIGKAVAFISFVK